MAKQRTDTEAVIRLVIDGKQAKTSGKELQDTFNRLRTELKNLKEEDDPKLYRQKAEELKKVKAAWEGVRHEINGTTNEVKSFKDSIKDLAADAVGGLSIGGAIYAAGSAFKTLVVTNAELSDSYGRVQKTTGLTEEAVDRLNDKFKKMDTRTANAELLGLAEVAGKLGISAEKDVEGFVRAADKIGVALGEDLGGVEESINSLGKLTDIFKIKDTYGIEAALLKVGSAINTLGASGTAAEKNLVDFSNRLAGVAPAANISLPAVLGLAAVQDELGQSMESSSTAIGQFIVGMGADIPKFAKIAGMAVGSFSKLLKEDANEALLRVLERAKSTGGGLEVLAKNMGILEVEGGRGVAALGAMADNIDLVRRRQAESQKAFEDGTSVLDEFNTMNNTLGANLEKIGNKLSNFWQVSWIRNGLTYLTGALLSTGESVDELTRKTDKQNEAFNKTKNEVSTLVTRYDELKSITNRSALEQEELNKIIQNIAKILPDSVTEWNKYGNALDINRDKVHKMSVAEQELYNIRNKSEIAFLNASFENQKRYAETMTSVANNLQSKITNSENGFLSLFGIDKKGIWKNELDYAKEQSILAADEMIKAAEKLRERGQILTDEQQKALYEKSLNDSVLLDVTLPGPKKNTTGLTGGEDKKKGKTDAQKEIERVKSEYDKLLKGSKAFGATRLMDQLATNEKELAQEAEKYDKQIQQWEDFKAKKGISTAQLAEANKQIGQLEKDRDKSLADLKVKQEKETTKKIEDLRTNLSNKLASELEKERVRINQFYDELEKNAGNDTDEVARIREAKQKDLADAVIREEKRIKDETAKLKNETVDLDGDSFDKRLAKVKSAYALELDELKAKYANELGTQEAFLLAEQALKEKYDAQESGIKAEKATKEAEKDKEKAKERREALLDITQSTADAVFDIMANNRQAETDAILSSIEKQREKELSNKNLTESQKQKINEKYDRQARAEKLRAWKAEKAAALSQSFINTALAVTKALPNVFLAAAAGAAGLLQSVTIAAQKPPIFAKGGIIPNGPSHAQGGLNVVDRRNRLIANIEGGEPILSRDTYANNREVVDALIYSSQRKAGARVNINPMLLDVEQSVRRGGMAMQRPIVNVDNSNAMDMDALAQSVERMVDNKINNIRVNLSYHDLQESNDKVVSIKNSVDA